MKIEFSTCCNHKCGKLDKNHLKLRRKKSKSCQRMNIITYVVWVYKQLMDAQHIRVGRYIEIHEIECDRERKNRRYCLVNTGLGTKKATELFFFFKKKRD